MIRSTFRHFVSLRSSEPYVFLILLLSLSLTGSFAQGQAQTKATPDVTPIPASTFDASSQQTAILKHLNAALRFYRDSTAAIQKVGEPGDTYYSDQAASHAAKIVGYAFESAEAETKMMASSSSLQSSGATTNSSTEKLIQTIQSTEQRINVLKARDATLDKQIAVAAPRRRAELQQQLTAVDGELKMRLAVVDALNRIVSLSTNSGGGFSGQISQLKRSAPGIRTGARAATPPNIESLSSARTMGVTSQAKVLFELLHTLEAIRALSAQSSSLSRQATALRAPLLVALRRTIAEGQSLATPTVTPVTLPVKPVRGRKPAQSKQPVAASAAPAVSAAATAKIFNGLTRQFNQLSAATVPLSEEILALEQNRAGLAAWSNAVDQEYDSVLRSLVTRVVLIAIALLIIFLFSEGWRRGAKRYVQDVRRRRQMFVLRRFVTAFLMGLVLIFGLVTQFSSLATFVGLITAGIAVGLQTVLLSIAAYFFIVGRYGIKPGDRVTVAGVTGDVMGVGLLRFYVMEMSGSGTDLYPTGRVAVLSNAVLFHATTPLCKQMPETGFAWREVLVKLTPGVDYRPTVAKLLELLESIYSEYRDQIEYQHRTLKAWMDSDIDMPEIHSALRLADGGPQFCARYPVTLREASSIDGRVTAALMDLMAKDDAVKTTFREPPVIMAPEQIATEQIIRAEE